MKQYAALGLLAWYQNMIPSLLPFMILSNLIMNLNLEARILKPVNPLFETVFRIKREAVFVICFGFLCGFPMGCKLLSDLYRKGKIDKAEAEYLLAFTNNIGPAYYICYVYPVFYQGASLPFLLFLQYGVVLLYGLFLRHTYYHTRISYTAQTAALGHTPRRITLKSVVYALDDAINTGLIQIAALGGYMVVFNVLVYFPYKLLSRFGRLTLLCHLGMEITGGLQALSKVVFSGGDTFFYKLLLIQGALALNGLCCLFQTMKFLKGTDLSVKKYMLHKGILCSITVALIFATHMAVR